MKEKQQTRDELFAEVTILRKANIEWMEADKRTRTEFAKAFRWGMPKKQDYGYSIARNVEEWDWKMPTWEQIFVEIGKLKSLMDYRDFDGNISEIETKLEQLARPKEKCKVHFNEQCCDGINHSN